MVRISQARFNRVKHLLLRRLRHVMREAEGGAATAAEAGGSEGGSYQEGGTTSQSKLVSWYLDEVVAEQQVETEEQLSEEYRLVRHVIRHMVDVDKSLVVASQPEQQPGEGMAEYALRVRRERQLRINADMDMEDL